MGIGPLVFGSESVAQSCWSLLNRPSPSSERYLNSQYSAKGATILEHSRDSTIPRISDQAAYEANITAIDQRVTTDKYFHIVAWGKWLGFTPETVRQALEVAESDLAPSDAIQKIDGRWLRLHDIQNESNRNRVDELARRSEQERL